MEIIDRTLNEVRLIATIRDTKHWIECYLHEASLAPERYAVVERININSRGGSNDFDIFTTNDLAEAEARYVAAEARVKAAIAEALK